MATLTLKELRLKTDAALMTVLTEKQDALRELRFKVSSRQHKNHQELKAHKKEIARIQTILKEKKLLAATTR